MYADNYFEPDISRTVKPLGGVSKQVPANKLVQLYTADELDEMTDGVRQLCLLAMKNRFSATAGGGKTIYIDPGLFKIPIAIGDRSESVQDISSALQGTRFKINGDKVRLFMQWGRGLSAQHMDMDLSVIIAFDNNIEYCSYYNLVASGCRHSGDIRHIPDQVGTAEYIEIDLPDLETSEARYITFSCNAYSNGSITPNLIIGWMNSEFEMRISEETGVAYDPSCVQHQVRITSGLAKGLVFGVLDIAVREIIWLEVPFQGQIVNQLDASNVKNMIRKLEAKLTIGQLLQIKAEAQNMKIVDEPAADEMYTKEWAQNTAALTSLLVD